MTFVQVAAAASEDLATLIQTHELPPDTKQRVAHRLETLALFPNSGPLLHGPWHGLRRVLGPWPWMLIIYTYDEAGDTVTIVTIQDGRTSTAATNQ